MRAAICAACFLLRVVVDVEVVGLQDLEVEFAVLDLVPAEVAPLGKGYRGQPEQETQGCRDEGEVTFHIVSAEATDVPTASRIFLEETLGWGASDVWRSCPSTHSEDDSVPLRKR